MPQLPPSGRWTYNLDLRDALAAGGGVLVFIGACAFHWAAGLAMIGVGMIALGWRLAGKD